MRPAPTTWPATPTSATPRRRPATALIRFGLAAIAAVVLSGCYVAPYPYQRGYGYGYGYGGPRYYAPPPLVAPGYYRPY